MRTAPEPRQFPHREPLRPFHPELKPGLTRSRREPALNQRQLKAQPRQGWGLPGRSRTAALQLTRSQIADPARDNAVGAPCGGRGIYSASPSVRPASWGHFRWTERWVPRRSPPSPVVAEHSGKPRHIADNSWVTIRTAIQESVPAKTQPPEHSVQPEPDQQNPNLFSYLSQWHRRAKFTILPIQTTSIAITMIRFR